MGRLEPAGDTRLLAAPITGIGGSPRITSLLVGESDPVSRGQLLARFDNGPALRAERLRLQTRIVHLQRRLSLQRRDLERFRSLLSAGAIPASEVDQKETTFLALEGDLQESRAELLKVQADLVNSELRAPFAGTVLRVQARVGERPGEKGILELAANDRMEAVVEVYESDIDRVRLGQAVRISSENGGFSGQLQGRVARISPQVRQREVISTDPSGDVDARIVEVRVALDPADAQRVRDLTGLKIVARLER